MGVITPTTPKNTPLALVEPCDEVFGNLPKTHFFYFKRGCLVIRYYLYANAVELLKVLLHLIQFRIPYSRLQMCLFLPTFINIRFVVLKKKRNKCNDWIYELVNDSQTSTILYANNRLLFRLRTHFSIRIMNRDNCVYLLLIG